MKREILHRRHLGEALARRRRKAGWAQKKLAEESGVNSTSISKYERGNARIGKENLKKLCGVLGCSPEQFLQEAWKISEEGHPREQASNVTFPEAELARIYDEAKAEEKRFFLKAWRVIFEAMMANRAKPG